MATEDEAVFGKIFPGFYIGNIETSKHKEILAKDLRLSHILIIVPALQPNPSQWETYQYDFEYLTKEFVGEQDSAPFRYKFSVISALFDETNEYIENARKEGSGVYICSPSGLSLATTFSMAYIIWKLKPTEVTLKDAFDLVKDSKVKNVRPSAFQAQVLKDYYQKLLKDAESASASANAATTNQQNSTDSNITKTNNTKESKQESEVIVDHQQSQTQPSSSTIDIDQIQNALLATSISTTNNEDEQTSSNSKEEESATNDSSTAIETTPTTSTDSESIQVEEEKTTEATPIVINASYHCRKCRLQLFHESHIIPHELGEGQNAFDYHKRSAVLSNEEDKPPTVCTSIFVDADQVPWMNEEAENGLEGRLLCPKCSSRVGSWKWDGAQCSCGAWLTPCFQVLRKLVDQKIIK